MSAPAGLLDRLHDEADLCRNEGADDIANLLDEAIKALTSRTSIADRIPGGCILHSAHYVPGGGDNCYEAIITRLMQPAVRGTGATIEDAVDDAIKDIKP